MPLEGGFFMRKMNRIIRTLFAFFLLIGLAWPAQAKKLKVRVGYFPNITHAQALVGMGNGYFAQKLGSNVEIEPYLFNAGPSAMEALLAKQLDLVYVGPNPALNTHLRSKGRALRILAGACSGGAALVLRQDRQVQRAAELNRMKLGTPQLGNTQDIALRYYLLENNLKSKGDGGTIAIFPSGNSNLILLFKRGEIDGAWTVEPWVSRLVLEEEGYIFLNEDELWPQGFYPTTYLVGAVDFIKKHPQVVKEWVKAHLDLTVRLQTNPEEYMAEINREMEKWMGKPLPMKILRSAFSRLHFTCRPMEEPFMVMAERAYCLGFLQEMPTNLSAGFELTFLEEGLKELGYAEIP